MCESFNFLTCLVMNIRWCIPVFKKGDQIIQSSGLQVEACLDCDNLNPCMVEGIC